MFDFSSAKSLHCFVWFLLYYLLHPFSSDYFAALTSLLPYNFFIWTPEFSRNYPWRRVFCNVNLSNLENVFQRNLRTDRFWGCIFRASGGEKFEHFRVRHHLVALSWVWCMCQSAQKNSGYVTVLKQLDISILWTLNFLIEFLVWNDYIVVFYQVFC